MLKIRRYRKSSPNLRIAIIVRTRNRPHLLTRCLHSLAEQKRLPDEVIIVNDGGQPITPIVQLYSGLNLHLISNPTSLGRAQAGNQGVQASRSEVIGFLDDDDRYLPDHLLRLEKALLYFDSKIVYSGCRLLQRDVLGEQLILREQTIGQFNEPYQAERLKYENYIPLINLLIDRNLWTDLGGFDEQFELFEDWDILLRLSQHTQFYHLNKITTEYAIWSHQQITQVADKARWQHAYQQMLHKHWMPLAPEQMLPQLAEYWRLSQERRGNLREYQEDKQQLHLQLLRSQHDFENLQRQLADYRGQYDRLEREHALSQKNWQREHQRLQKDYEQLQKDSQQQHTQLNRDWQHKYDQSQSDWNRRYEHLQAESTQTRLDWQRKYEQLQTQYTQLQIDWQRKYEQHQFEYQQLQLEHQQTHTRYAQQLEKLNTQHDTEVRQLQTNWTQRYQTLQTEHEQQQQQWQHAYHQQETHFKQQQVEMIQEINKNVHLYQQLQQATVQERDCCQTAHTRLHELFHQAALGLTQGGLARILSTQPQFSYPDLQEYDLRLHYQRLLDWHHQQWQTQRQQQQQQLQELSYELQILNQHNRTLAACLHTLTAKALRSRWLHYGGYVKLLDKVNQAAQRFTEELADYDNRLTLLNTAQPSPTSTIPEPRPISHYQPNFRTFARQVDHHLHLMDQATQAPDLPFHLGPQTALVMTVYCSLPNFCRLDLVLATYQRINACQLRVIIRQLQQPTPLRIIQFSGLQILDNLFHSIDFEAFPDSADQTYQIEIDSPDADEHNALAIWCHSVPLHQTPNPPTELTLPTPLPHWLAEGLFDSPLPLNLAHQPADHLFFITGTSQLLNLQILLRRLVKMLQQSQASACVIIAGELSPEILSYCQSQPLIIWSNSTTTLPVAPQLLHLLNYLQPQQASYLKENSWIWFCHPQALPDITAIAQAQTIFTQRPQAGLLVPAQINTAKQITAGYALIDQYGHCHHYPIGAPADHPAHAYQRCIEAASTSLVILKAHCLSQLSIKETAYTTDTYQVTELIWQLKRQHCASLYQSAFAYQDSQIRSPIDTSLYEQDRHRFLARWESQLLAETGLLLNHYTLLNPKNLPTLLIIEATLPAFDEDSGSLRLFTLIRFWVELGFRISFFPDNLDSQFKYRHALETLGVEVFHGQYHLMEALSYRVFDYAMICRVDIGHRYLPVLRLLSPATQLFYDTVDIHYIRELRQAEIENNLDLAIKAQETRRKELSNCLLANVTLTVTEEDARHLQQELPKLNYAILPNVHQLESPSNVPFEQREGLVFIGNYNHHPNEDAVYYLIEQVLPLIWERLPDTSLYLIGSHMKPAMKTLASPHIKVVGWVDQVAPEFAQRRVFVSYLRYGAGMKGKLGQALSLGLPIVTTQIGAEGMGLVEGETALIADDPIRFAQAVIQVYTDKTLWEKLALQGRNYIEQEFGEAAVKNKLRRLTPVPVGKVVSNLFQISPSLNGNED